LKGTYVDVKPLIGGWNGKCVDEQFIFYFPAEKKNQNVDGSSTGGRPLQGLCMDGWCFYSQRMKIGWFDVPPHSPFIVSCCLPLAVAQVMAVKQEQSIFFWKIDRKIVENCQYFLSPKMQAHGHDCQ
jgi:hypothetical protein